MRKALALILAVAFISILFIFDSGCANIIPPNGGPRDSLPPELINATPPDSTRNFNGNRIVLTFNEYVKLDNAFQNVLFSPTLENTPIPQERGKTVTLRFRDSLAPNTTYIINFGDAIKDINEGNTARNFTYVFSTGRYIDSLELNGKIIIAQTGKPADSTNIAVLYKDFSDSAVIKKRPDYITRVDGQGHFHFTNLPPGNFALYIFGNASMKRYDPSKVFSFSDSAVVPGTSMDMILYAYAQGPSNASNTKNITGNAPTKATEKRLQLATNLVNTQQDLLNDFILSFTTPLRYFDSTKVSLSTDSSFKPVSFSTAIDSTKKQIRFKTIWQEGTPYNLVLNKDFAEDTSGRKLLKSDTLHFTTKKVRDYSKLIVRIKNINTVAEKKPVLQFVQNDQVVFSAPISSGIFTQELFPPGDYQLRLLLDSNGNGIWDAGSFFGKKTQPERVLPIERKLTVKANIDNEVDIVL